MVLIRHQGRFTWPYTLSGHFDHFLFSKSLYTDVTGDVSPTDIDHTKSVQVLTVNQWASVVEQGIISFAYGRHSPYFHGQYGIQVTMVFKSLSIGPLRTDALGCGPFIPDIRGNGIIVRKVLRWKENFPISTFSNFTIRRN